MKVLIEKEVEVKYLQLDCGIRYLSDNTINGKEGDEHNTPKLENGRWKPLINLETKTIEDWGGVTMNVHSKVCDDGVYTLLDEHKQEIVSVDGYVPDMLSINDNGDGDCLIMQIAENGEIKDFKPDARYFEPQNDE